MLTSLKLVPNVILRCVPSTSTVKLGDKERFDKEQIGVKELCMGYQPFYTINILLDKELLPKLGVSEHEIVKISKKRGL